MQFHRPRGLDTDAEGNVVVLDHGNHRVQWIDTDGQYVDVFGARLYTKPARLPHTIERDPGEVEAGGGQDG